MILAIETATSVCSVALMTERRELIEKREIGKGIHSEKLFLFIEELMSEQKLRVNKLRALILSKGPGQFTGLRIGAACAKGLLFSTDIKFYTIGTLEGIAAGVSKSQTELQKRPEVIHTVLDARRNHLYYQRFQQKGDSLEKNEPQILEIGEIDKRIMPGDMVAGTGYERLTLFGEKNIGIQGGEIISAKNLVRCFINEQFRNWLIETNPSRFEPQYLTEGQVSRG